MGIGGAPLSLLYLIERLDTSVYEPLVIFLNDSEVIELFKEKGISCKVLDQKTKLFVHLEAFWYKWYFLPMAVCPLLSTIRVYKKIAKEVYLEEKPDIIHLNSLFLFHWTRAAKELQIPIICHVREALAEGYFGIRKNLIRNILKKNATKIIAISNDNAKRLDIPEKTVVIYNFIDFNYFSRKPYILPNSEDKKYALYLGGQIRYKGFYTMVRSLKYLNENIIVKFAGYYSKNLFHKNPIRTLFLHKMRKSRNAIEVGVITNVPGEMRKSSVIIFPATKPHFARPVIEAGAMGKPVIISALEGNNEMVEDQINGLMFNSRSPGDLASKINNLLNDENSMRKLGENGFKISKKKYNSKINAAETIQVYSDLFK